ncbi:MAG: methyl-accepting chemotaxis protein [Sulfuricellaceae bacterium]
MLQRISDLKIWVRLVAAIWLMLALAWTVMISWAYVEQKEMATAQAVDFANSLHQMTMAGLTGMMITGTVAQRAVYLDQIRSSSNISELRVIRGSAVVGQFGPGGSDEGNPDGVETQVLESGKPFFQVSADSQALRAVIPAVASSNYLGKNCLMCHQVREGTPLGAVSMRISLAKVSKTVRDFTREIALLAVAITVPLLGFIYLFIRRVVTRPLREMTHGLEDIAKGEGDLTRRLAVRSRDEIGQACGAFNEVMSKFSGLVRHVSISAAQVAAASRQLAEHSLQVAEGSRQQSEKSSQVAGAVETMAGSVAKVTSSAESVKELSLDSLKRSQEGNVSLSVLVAELDSVEAAVDEIATSVDQFMRSTEAITAMTRQVKDIAEQTNLLALNAAIEAARAGEHGRGFAVVADEVRKLAEKSAHAASEIDDVTQSITRQSQQVARCIDEGMRHLHSSQDSLENVAVVLSEASNAVGKVNNGLNSITAATEEQSAIATDVTRHMADIAVMTTDNTCSMADAAKETQHLEVLAESLQECVSLFKTE